MSAIPQPATTRLIGPSERILQPLRRVARRHWGVLAAKGVLQTLIVSLTLILVVALAMSFFRDIPVAIRVALAVLVWGSVIVAGVYFLRPALRRRSLVRTAMDVEARLATQRNTYERITSSVELGAESNPAFRGSPVLINHLIKQAEADAAAVDPRRVVPAKIVYRLAAVLMPVLLAWVILAWVMPKRIMGPLYHLLMPVQPLPAMLSDVVVEPGDVTLAEGDPLTVKVLVNPASVSERDKEVKRATITLRDAAGQPAVQELSRLAPRAFQYDLPAATRSFRYKVSTDGGDSPWYAATVNPRPSVQQLEIRYDYPSYTALQPRTDTNKEDGAIDGLAGTKVTVTVFTGGNLKEESRLVVSDDGPRLPGAKPEPKDYPLKKTGERQYAAELVLSQSGQYAIKLANEFNLNNRDDQPRPITVQPDQKPQVAITSPKAEVAVRPTETVPVAFVAGDDFGVAKVELLVEVEGTPARGTEVKLDAANRQNLAGQATLSVQQVLAAAGLREAPRITYWLRATDNRDPDPQVAESSRLTLRIDKDAESLALRQDQEHAKDLREEIKKAIERLTQVLPRVQDSKNVDKGRPMGNDDRRRDEESKDRLEKTSTELATAAGEHLVGTFAQMAARAKEIADDPIMGAAASIAKTSLHADQPDLRKQDAVEAERLVLDARKQLEELLKEVEKLEQAIEAQHKLEELANAQEKLAEAMQQAAEQAQKPDQQQQARNEQQQLAQELQKLLNENQALQDKKARQQAEALAELLRNVEEIQQKQQEQEKVTQKMAELAEVAEQAKTIAERQQALNEKVEQFRKEDKPVLDKAAAQPPEQKQLENIVKELNEPNLKEAVQQQNQAAEKLEQAANQLEQKANDPGMPQGQVVQEKQQAEAAQKAAAEAQQAAKDAQQAQDAAKNAAEEAKQAQAANNEEQKKGAAQNAADAAKKAAEMAKAAGQKADAVEKQAKAAVKDAANAEEVKQSAQAADDTADQAQAAAKEAQAVAEAAEQAAKENNAEEAGAKAGEAAEWAQKAAQKAAEAAQQLAQAEQMDAQQAKAEAQAGQMNEQQKQAAKEAAAEARQLAQEQRELAKATEPKAAQQEQAQQGTPKPAQAAQQQQAVAQQTRKAAQQAQQLEQMAEKGNNPNLAKRAEAAQQELKDAAEAQAQAAQAQQQGDAEQAAGAQEKAQNELAQAEQALRGLAQPPAGEMAEANAQAAKGEQGAQAQQGEKGAQAQQGEKGEMAQGEAAQGEMAQGEQGEPGEPGQAEGQAQGEAQGEAQAQAQAQGQGQGEPKGQGRPKGQGQPQQAAAAEPHPGEPGEMAQPAQAAADPAAAMQQAAQAAQEAAQAQQQAMQGGTPGNSAEAGAQAAQALGQAAEAMAAATAGQSQGQSQSQAQASAQGQGQQGPPTQTPGQSNDPKTGIAASLTGGSAERPGEVAALGISASDWARLGPNQQRELMNAAKQSGPPGYQSMIKNYYVRIARMQADGNGRR